ncbi:MAG: bifunctional precorrin-2 dehydrogenase/sirohydrochlorin ferrochelatase [Clostridium sp.]|nr:bifunctional precorrin-2 dehydrogenase/sirohydrochlorin ferrochelatase [Clostridium sp.]
MKKYYPIMIDIDEKKCAVIGGGKVAFRKIKSLIECNADVFVISKDIIASVKELLDNNRIKYIKAEYDFKYINDCKLAYAATDDNIVNRRIFNDCSKNNILVNVVDTIDECQFIVPSKVQRGDLTIAVSTNGKSPALSKKIRQDLEKKYDFRYEIFLEIMGRVRKRVSSEIEDPKKRSEFYNKIVYSDLIERINYENKDKCEDEIINVLEGEN